MSSPSDDSRPRRRVTLPPIRDFFRDEFTHSQSLAHEPPATTLARLRMNDDGSESLPIRPLSPRPSGLPTRMYRSTSDQFPSADTHQFSQRQLPSNTPLYQEHYQSVESSTSHSHPFAPQRLGVLPVHGPADYPASHSHPSTSPHSPDQPRGGLMDTSNRHLYPSYGQGFHASREPVRRSLAPTLRSSTPLDPTRPAQVHGPDSPPALVRAVAPWVIATDLDMGQIYEDDERTPIARPFDVGPTGHSPSHAVSLGRFFDEGSQPPLGKYDCKFCGKLFNRPSSLRIHLNSHTGEKPFVCPYPDCGRSFSVLSNMRRHARVHMNSPKEHEPEESNEEASSQSSSTNPSTPKHSSVAQESAPVQSLIRSQTHYRQDSDVSASSSGSRQSHGTPSDGGQVEGLGKSGRRSRQRSN